MTITLPWPDKALSPKRKGPLVKTRRKKLIIAVDPGTSGCIVFLSQMGDYIDHMHMPVVKHGTNTRVDGAAIARALAGQDITHSYLESVHAMPAQGVRSVFTFGHAAGLVEGVITGAMIPITLVTPQAWKKSAGLIGSDKDAARSRAIHLFPGIPDLALKGKGQALADALLIGLHGVKL
jgi:crossover junction endodeoxyribonuclease RuvC